MKNILAEMSKHPVGNRLSLNGTIIVGRDIAHAKLKERIDSGEGLPSGSFEPTTAGRMDSYVDIFQSKGRSMIMIAKCNRGKAVSDACKKYGGFYLGSIGVPAAILAQDNITKVELLEYTELGMEAIFNNNCAVGIEANLPFIQKNLENSLMLVTSLNRHIGYDNAAIIAKKAHTEGLTHREAAIATGLVTDAQFTEWAGPEKMIGQNNELL